MSRSYKIGLFAFLTSFVLSLVLGTLGWFLLKKDSVINVVGDLKIFSLEALVVDLFVLFFLTSLLVYYFMIRK